MDLSEKEVNSMMVLFMFLFSIFPSPSLFLNCVYPFFYLSICGTKLILLHKSFFVSLPLSSFFY